MKKQEIILATHNQGKFQEFNDLFSKTSIQLRSLQDFQVSDIEETGLTFVENALIKARYASKYTGLPAIADDSGLVVPSLGGAPGIHSARFAGPKASPEKNIQKLLQILSEKPLKDRQAYFICILVYLRMYDDPVPEIVKGRWKGEILLSSRGEKGFGYDPIFYVPTHQCSAAELERHEKNKISHRAQASACLLDWLVKQC